MDQVKLSVFNSLLKKQTRPSVGKATRSKELEEPGVEWKMLRIINDNGDGKKFCKVFFLKKNS